MRAYSLVRFPLVCGRVGAGRFGGSRHSATWHSGVVALHPDRLLPPEPVLRRRARAIYESIRELPVVSVHGHVDASMLRADEPFADPASLLITSDHYVLRALHSVGVPLDRLGRGPEPSPDARSIWHELCRHWHALRGSATGVWLAHELGELFGVDVPLDESTADESFDLVAGALARPEFRPQALFRRFNLEILSTTDGLALSFDDHLALQDRGLRVVPTIRPDALTDPLRPGWQDEVERRGIDSCAELVEVVGCARRASGEVGAVATDHGHVSPHTEEMSALEAETLFTRLRDSRGDSGDAHRLAGHLLLRMAALAVEDGLVMQLHPGVLRDHDRPGVKRYGPDSGSDFPVPVSFTAALRPLLERYGSEPGFRLVVFTVDETVWSRELGPMASYYPGLYLGAPWWFLDAPSALARHFDAVTEVAGYSKLSGFVDDTRAFCSIPARHDVARRALAAHLSRVVGEHRVTEGEAAEIAHGYAYAQPRSIYRVS